MKLYKPDWFDIVGAAGLLLLIAGVAAWSVPAAMITTGISLLLIALGGARNRRGGGV